MSKETEAAEEKFEIAIDEKEEFACVAEQNILTSTNLCHLFTKIFEVYDDFKGLRADVNSFGQVTLSAFFNHYDFSEDAITAFSKDAAGKSSSNETLERVRRMNRIAEEGIKYYPTKEGKEGMENFIMIRDNRGKVIWSRAAADVAAPVSAYGQQEILSVIYGIDPTRLLKECYGAKDENGNEYEYSINVIGSKPSAFGGNKEYTFSIMRINKKELDRAARDTGIVVGNVLGIVK